MKRCLKKTNMKALDLFCGAGGASQGLANAGFDVFGIDQKIYRRDRSVRNPILFDWLETEIDESLLEWITKSDFDFIWASPPCQAFSLARGKNAKKKVVNLIPLARSLIEESGVSGVIENVPKAPIRKDLVLDGRHINTPDMVRRRHFEFIGMPAPLSPPLLCKKAKQVVCLAGDSYPSRGAKNRNDLEKRAAGYRKFMHLLMSRKRHDALEWKRRVIGCDWMSWRECNDAVPAGYAEFIGKHAIKHLKASVKNSTAKPVDSLTSAI